MQNITINTMRCGHTRAGKHKQWPMYPGGAYAVFYVNAASMMSACAISIVTMLFRCDQIQTVLFFCRVYRIRVGHDGVTYIAEYVDYLGSGSSTDIDIIMSLYVNLAMLL